MSLWLIDTRRHLSEYSESGIDASLMAYIAFKSMQGALRDGVKFDEYLAQAPAELSVNESMRNLWDQIAK